MTSIERPNSPFNPSRGNSERPTGTGREVNSERNQLGKPPTIQWILLIICSITPVLTLILNRSGQSLVMNIAGFLFGTFVGVIAFAWFLIADNGERSKSYRDWPFVSPRASSTWILLLGWIFGLCNMFIVSIELSRHLAGTK